MPLRLLQHPLAEHLLTGLRDKSTPPESFRTLSKKLMTLLVMEATWDLATQEVNVETPIRDMQAKILAESLAVVPVLRAGLGLLDPVVEMFPDVAVGYIGLERHEDTAIARSYYCKLPNLKGKYTLCIDPMLATGGSAVQAVSLIKPQEPAKTKMICVVVAPEGLAVFEKAHPDVEVVAAALDESLDERKYIVPGVGDFGDRLYGTF